MADFEKNKFSLTTVLLLCGGLITLIGYLNTRFNAINDRFDYFEKKYLMAITEQGLINQGTEFRLKILEKTANKENKQPNFFHQPQAILPNGTQLEDDKSEA